MNFCSECHNMYYLKIKEGVDETDTALIYYCRNCGHEDTSLNAANICVSETQVRRNENKYTQMVNEYTKYDPTLPRINTIKCPNQECSSNVTPGSAMPGSAMPMPGSAMPMATPTPATMRIKKSNNKKKTALALATEGTATEGTATEGTATEGTATEGTATEGTTTEEVEATASKVEFTPTKIANPLAQTPREVIYIRYDDINVKYVYLCVHCDTMWKTDYRN